MTAVQEVGTPTTEVEAPERDVPALVRIPHGQARDLHWYFEEHSIAGVAIASDMGAMLERAALMAIRLVPCKACGGSPLLDRPGTGNCPRRGSYTSALRKWHLKQADSMGRRLVPTEADIASWAAVKVAVDTFVSSEVLGTELPDDLTKFCKKCQGTGMLERRQSQNPGNVTARPTGSSSHGNPDAMHNIDDEGLQRWGRINRQLEDVCEESPLARVALGKYYGPGGGSISCLWELTESGDRFLANTPNPLKLSPDQIMGNTRDEQAKEPEEWRTRLFSALARECAKVWDHTCATWVRVNPEVTES
jgi:hypothetical protein